MKILKLNTCLEILNSSSEYNHFKSLKVPNLRVPHKTTNTQTDKQKALSFQSIYEERLRPWTNSFNSDFSDEFVWTV